MAEFPTYEQMAKNVAEKALDEILYQGKSIREWMKTIIEQELYEDAISRKAVIDKIKEVCFSREQEWVDFRVSQGSYGQRDLIINFIEDLPSIQPEPKTGHWIEVTKYSDGRHEIECSKCGSHIFDRGHANSYVVKEKYKYCPRCGAKMEESEEA